MKTTKYIVTIAIALVCAWGNSFAVDQSYYSSVDGKSGTNLRDALYTITSAGPKNMSYNGLWTAYKTTDVYPSGHAKAGKIWDMYGGCTFTYSSDQCGNYDNVCDCYNREHSLPKSWFNDATPAYYDLGHIVPTDGKVNGMRSNYIFGEVGSGAATWGTGKLGNAKSITVENVKGSSTITTTITSTAFEPEDQYKGDFARMYMYMAVRYKHGNSNGVDLAASGDGKKMFNSTDANYGLTDYSIALLMKWHRQDAVSQKEIDRNNGMLTVQNNRNPFVDYPDLAEYLWGDKAGSTVTLASLDNTFGGEVSSYSISLYRNGETTIINDLSGSYTLPAKNSEDPACTNWAFDGWSTTQISETTTKPTYVTNTSSAGTIYAVYAKTTPSSAPMRKTAAAVGATLWAEDFSGYSANDVPSGSVPNSHTGTTVYDNGSVTYSVTNGGGTTKVYNENTGGGTAPEILIAKNGGSFSISGIPTGGATAMTLTFKTNQTSNISVSSGTTGITVGSVSITNGTATCEITNASAASFDLTITKNNSGNSREDNFLLVVKTAGSGGGGGSTTYDSDPDDCHCTGNLSTPSVTATPSDGTITLTWDNDANATNGYTVTIGKGVGYTTECGETEIGAVSLSGSTNTCVITGLINGLEYTASVVANATATTCASVAGTATETPVGCESWNVTFGYSSYSLTAGGAKSAAPTITGTTYGSVTYHSSDEAIITVDEDGKVTPVSAGTATITARWTGYATHCPKDVISSEFTVTGLVRITFDANDGSVTPATTTQDVTYNVETALTANSFSRTGYTFQGWSTDKNATSATYTDGENITITAATTLYAVWQVNKHSVTFAQPESGGTFTVNSSSSSPVNNVDFSSTVTIAITPTNSHFSVGTVSVSGASGAVAVSGEGNSRTFTMPDEDVTVSVTMDEETKYTVNWYVAGTPTAEQNYAGEALAGIANPSIDCNGKTFQGWTSLADYSSDNTAPTDLFTDASTKTMPSNNTTNYYAVFATESTSGSSKTYNLELNGDNFGNNYNERSSSATANEVGGTGTLSVSFTTTGVMKSTNTGNPIQFRKSGSGAGVLYNTTDLGTINSITYGSGSTNNIASTYKGATEQPTSDGTGGYFKITNGSSVSYLTSITINFTKTTGGGTTYSDYTTSCAAPTEVTVTFHANYEGADPATATQTIPYNTATALTANSFSQTGYSFQGWATSPSGSKEYDDGASVTLTSNTHLYAVWQKNSHDVIFTPAPTGATVTINGQSTSPQSVEYGETVTIVITPDATYDLNSVSATGVSLSGEGNSRTFTMPDADVTVTVTMTPKPTYEIKFYNMGAQIGSTQNLYVGATATLPPAQTACEGYDFVGWWTAALAEDNTDTHTWITADFTVSEAANQDYYAVYSHSEGTGGSGSSTTINADDFSSVGSGSEIGSQTISGITITGAKNTHASMGPKYYSGTPNTIRCYVGNKITISASSISQIDFTYDGSYDGGTISVSTGAWEGTPTTNWDQTWKGSADDVAFTINGTNQWRITAIKVTYGGGGTTYYTTAPDCVECLNKVTLTKGTPTNGSFDLDKADGEYNNCTSNFVVTVSNITPADHYHCTGVTATGGNSEVSGPDGSGNYTVTYTKGNSITSTITANFAPNPTYAIRFFSNSAQVGETQNLFEGQTATKPSPNPTACDGYTFVGWWTAALEPDNTTAETWVTDFTVTGAQDYYAVYSKTTEGGGTSKTYTLVLNGNNFAGSYAERSSSATANEDGGSGTLDVNFTSNGVMKSSNSGNPIQFRKSGSGAGVLYNTTDLGTINSITYGDGSTNNIASTYKGATAQPTSDGTGGYFKITNGASVSYITSITINFTKTTGSSTTYYTTNPDCCSEVVAPTVNATAKSTSATISWNNQATATNGYSVVVKNGNTVIFENNSIAAGTTSCVVSGLTPSTNYTYTVTAKGATCNSSAAGNFTTTVCDDSPALGIVTVTPTTATIPWTSEAATATIRIYTDEACTDQVGSDLTSCTSPYTVNPLTSNTTYYYIVLAGGTCASAVGTFTTEEIELDIAEWQTDAVVISYNGDASLTLTTYTEETHGDPHANVADDIFFSKYFEAAANVKLLAIFNGTLSTVDLSNYQLGLAQAGAGTSQTKAFEFKKFSEFVKFSGGGLTEDELLLKSNEELILITYTTADNDEAIINCALSHEENSHFSTYVRLTTPNLQFNGDDAVALVNPDGDMIDLIGAGTKDDGLNREGTSFIYRSSGTDYNGFMDTPGGWYTENGYKANADNTETANYALSTNRCLLIRRNHVKSGHDAVERNQTDFITLGDYNYLETDYEGEWKGVQIPGSTTEGTKPGLSNSCDGFEVVGSYDYNDYYVAFETDITNESLDGYKSDPFDGTYVIPVTDLQDKACTQVRVELKDGSDNLIIRKDIKVPIMISSDQMTTDAIFHSNDKDASICRECDVVILSGASLTKVPDGTMGDISDVRDLTIYPTGKLIVPDERNYTVNSLTLLRQEDEVASANIEGILTIKETDGVNFDIRVDPTNWHYISLPYDCNVQDITFSTGEPATLGTDYLIKWYNGEKRAATQSGGCWEMVASDATLKAGLGYIFSIPGDGKVMREFRFPMDNEVIAQEKADKMVNGVYSYGGDQDMNTVRANHRGWNLLGNPYLMPYSSDITDPLMTGYIVPDYPSDPEEIWDGHYKFDEDPTTHTYLRYIVEPIDNGWSGYAQVTIASYEMKPFTSYFVQIGGDHPEDPQGINFHVASVSHSPVRRAPAEYEEVEDRHPVWCAVTLTNPKGEKDETTLLISDNFTDGYDMMDDLTKWRGTYYQYAQITTAPVLASRNNEGEMAFNALPDSSALAGVPLNYFAASQGFYTIAYDDKYDRDMEVKEVKLWDKTTNQWYNLMYEPYSFSTARTDNKDRFVLSVRVERKQNQTTTDLENVGTYKGDKPRKLLINGLLYIQRGKDVYDVTGKQL